MIDGCNVVFLLGVKNKRKESMKKGVVGITYYSIILQG
jgi:hypothetical protein